MKKESFYNRRLFIILSLLTLLVLIITFGLMFIAGLNQREKEEGLFLPSADAKYMPCAPLSSTDAVKTCQQCIDAGDGWTMFEGCVSRFNPKFACKDEPLFEDAKNCVQCVEGGGKWEQKNCSY